MYQYKTIIKFIRGSLNNKFRLKKNSIYFKQNNFNIYMRFYFLNINGINQNM